MAQLPVPQKGTSSFGLRRGGRAIQVDARPGRLGVLLGPGNAVDPAILLKLGAGLLETEGHPRLQALLAQGEDPLVPAQPGARPALPAGDDPGDAGAQQPAEVNLLQERLADEEPLPDGQGEEEGEALLTAPLVFDGAADGEVGVPIPPIRGNAVPEPADPLGDDEEGDIRKISGRQGSASSRKKSEVMQR